MLHTLSPRRIGGNAYFKLSKEEIMKYHIAILSLTLSAAALAAELPVNVPAEPNTQFFIVEKTGSSTERVIIIKCVGPSGTSYAKRLYNCNNNTFKQLGSGSNLTQINESRPEINMRPIPQESIADYLGIEACK